MSVIGSSGAKLDEVSSDIEDLTPDVTALREAMEKGMGSLSVPEIYKLIDLETQAAVTIDVDLK